MNKQEILKKLNEIAKPSTAWIAEAKIRVENRKSFQYSQEVAIRILRELRLQKKSQINLAEALNVSPQQVNKWVKGNENFTFQTIAKIEAVLGIQIIHFQSEKSNAERRSVSVQTNVIVDRSVQTKRNYVGQSAQQDCRIVHLYEYVNPTKLAQ